jgi:hypothetical protein
VVTVTGPDGKVLVTEGEGQGKVMWKDLTVAATVVTANQKGVVSLPADPRVSDGQLPHVTVTVPSHPDLRADLDIPVQYSRAFQAHFSGPSGFSGSNGSDGRSGSSGSSGSTDPDHPSAGGNGEDGGNGDDGGDGGPGGNGPPVDVWVTLKSGSHPLLQVSVAAEGRTRLFLVDPDGGSLTVTSNGGSGGSGGRGGRGGSGGSGGNGSPSGMSGSSGRDGRNGSDGPPGNGGQITLVSDPQVRPYLPAIKLYSPSGPRPVVREMRMAPIW